MSKVVIINYGAGNVQSVRYAFQRLGVKPILSNDAREIKKAERVIFPGVGHAKSAMEAIKKCGLDKVIPALKQPVLGICLGMQLLCEFSEESSTLGLGIFSDRVKRFTAGDGQRGYKIPHMGWNQVGTLHGDLFKGIPERTNMYFVHSYYVPMSQYSCAVTDYFQPFSAALQRKNFYACQFHPEKSGKAGENILENFLKI